MTTVYLIKCKKCGNNNVIDYTVPPKTEYVEISTEDYINKQKTLITNSVYFFTHHKLICPDCGHIEHYHE